MINIKKRSLAGKGDRECVWVGGCYFRKGGQGKPPQQKCEMNWFSPLGEIK